MYGGLCSSKCPCNRAKEDISFEQLFCVYTKPSFGRSPIFSVHHIEHSGHTRKAGLGNLLTSPVSKIMTVTSTTEMIKPFFVIAIPFKNRGKKIKNNTCTSTCLDRGCHYDPTSRVKYIKVKPISKSWKWSCYISTIHPWSRILYSGGRNWKHLHQQWSREENSQEITGQGWKSNGKTLCSSWNAACSLVYILEKHLTLLNPLVTHLTTEQPILTPCSAWNLKSAYQYCAHLMNQASPNVFTCCHFIL